MSMLGEQIKELHEMADAMHRRSREIGLDYGMGRSLADASRMLREAAHTIESLRDRLQESYGLVPELGKRENESERESYNAEPPYDVLLRCLENDYGIRASWDGLRRVWFTESVTAELDYIEDKSRWFELFGTPERAARTLSAMCLENESCDHCEMKRTIGGCGSYDALLEWLEGDSDG